MSHILSGVHPPQHLLEYSAQCSTVLLDGQAAHLFTGPIFDRFHHHYEVQSIVLQTYLPVLFNSPRSAAGFADHSTCPQIRFSGLPQTPISNAILTACCLCESLNKVVSQIVAACTTPIQQLAKEAFRHELRFQI